MHVGAMQVRFTSFKGPRDSATAAVDAVDSTSAAGRLSGERLGIHGTKGMST